MCVCVGCAEFFVYACVGSCVFHADAPFARVVVGECQSPMGGSQCAGAARAAAATLATSLLT